MSDFAAIHRFPHTRLPRARVDAIDSWALAWAFLDLLVERPLTFETIALLLDHDRRGIGALCVNGTIDCDAVLDVVDTVVALDSDEVGGLIVCSVRPPRPGVPDIDDVDAERWMEINDIAAAKGIEIVEWCVMGRALSFPRDLLCEPPRWAS
jgi:hypothetical protein